MVLCKCVEVECQWVRMWWSMLLGRQLIWNSEQWFHQNIGFNVLNMKKKMNWLVLTVPSIRFFVVVVVWKSLNYWLAQTNQLAYLMIVLTLLCLPSKKQTSIRLVSVRQERSIDSWSFLWRGWQEVEAFNVEVYPSVVFLFVKNCATIFGYNRLSVVNCLSDKNLGAYFQPEFAIIFSVYWRSLL